MMIIFDLFGQIKTEKYVMALFCLLLTPTTTRNTLKTVNSSLLKKQIAAFARCTLDLFSYIRVNQLSLASVLKNEVVHFDLEDLLCAQGGILVCKSLFIPLGCPIYQRTV